MNFFDLSVRRASGILVASHRGATGSNIPSNTLESYALALRQGADIIELDVTKSLDGELFAFHPYMDFPHLRKIVPLQLKTANSIKKIRYVNDDLTRTQYGIPTLDEALDFLKDKCIINVDKFWSNPKLITDKLSHHNIRDGVIVKSYYSKAVISQLTEVASDIPFMLMLRKADLAIEESLLRRGVNFVGEELIFANENDYLVSEEHMEFLKKNHLYAWGNTIVYNYKDVISAGKTDDKAILGAEDEVWGWFIKKGFDIIQTDWVRELKEYLSSK